ncbi:MAG: hypothetical protein ACOYXA_09315 [Bacteroidota bacterium]
MSHVKNLQAFGKLIGHCTGYGGAYNPGQQNLQVNALATLLNNAQQKIHDVQVAAIAYDHAVNDRAERTDEVVARAGRVLNLLKAMNLPAATLADARALVRSLRATVAAAPEPETSPEATPAGRRARGGDYGTRIARFAKLVAFVETLAYQPNEPELALQGLRQTLAALQQAHDRVNTAYVALNNARLERDKVMYQGPFSVVRTALAVKRYVQGVYGTVSSQYRDVSPLRFTMR